jgi:putative ABC transport system ATP-binding protein
VVAAEIAREEIVVCEAVSKVYRTEAVDVRALTDVTLRVRRAEFTTLVGPSGSGKTTLLNLIGGLDRPSGGRITVDGERIDALSATALADLRLRRIGFVFQAYNLVPVLSARENVELVMELQGVDAEARAARSRAVLDEVGLGDLADRRPAELSGGQQQRVAVARAIVSRPAVVLADEPTANLDSHTAADLLETMQALNETRGITFLFSTHDRLVMDFARRLVTLHDGRVVEDQARA